MLEKERTFSRKFIEPIISWARVSETLHNRNFRRILGHGAIAAFALTVLQLASQQTPDSNSHATQDFTIPQTSARNFGH